MHQKYTLNYTIVFILFLVFLTFGLHSCKTAPNNNNNGGLTTVTTGKDTTITNTNTPNKTDSSIVKTEPTPKIDTIRWCDTLQKDKSTLVVVCFEKIGRGSIKADTVDYIQIISDEPNPIGNLVYGIDSTIITKGGYKVVIIMPFMSKSFKPSFANELPGSALKAVEFYEGVQIALDSLEQEGIKLFVDVFDSMRDTNAVKALLEKPELLEADLIIGPVRTNTLQLVADFALKNKTPLLSPFNPRQDIVENNPYYIQLNPSFEVYSKKIIEQMHKITQRNRYRQLDKQILIIAKKSDSLRVQQLQRDFAVQSNDQTAILPQYLSDDASIKVNFIRPLMDRAKLNVVLIPSTDEAFVYNSLREIQSLVNKVEPFKGYQIAIVGMSKWKYYDRITFEYYESLNLHLPSEFYISKNKRKNIQFKNGYRSNYGIAPREFGYIGFDAMLYCGRMLKEYGINFQAHLWKKPLDMRHTSFHFLPNIENTSPLDGRTETAPFIRNFENKYVHFLYFGNYELKPTNYK